MQRIHVTIRPLNREDSVLYFPPEAFGPFRVLHQIGAGTLGPVFRAYEPADAADERRDRLVAVKVFRLDLTPEQAAALVDALDTLVASDISHPNIAAPIAAGLEHGTAYLAQEYAIGDSLDVVLRERGPMPIPDVVALVGSLADAIDHAAGRGVHHGLLHPRDVVLGADTARLTGFGITEALSKAGARLPARRQYAPANARSDVYSLGAIAFEIVTGKRVSDENLKDVEAAHGKMLRDAFDLALAANSDMRPRAAEFAQALRGATGQIGATGATGAKPAPAPLAPLAPEDSLDRVIDLTPPDHPDNLAIEPDYDPPSRWPIVAVFLAVAILTAVAVGFFLRAPSPAPEAEAPPGVDATTVDLPAAAPASPEASAGKPAAAPARPASPERRRDKPASSTPVAPGRLLIRSSPADADVWVNGQPRGKTPLALRDLTLGSYTIRVGRNGYSREERTLQLTSRRPTLSTTFDLRSQKTGPGGISVQSRPAGARVFVDNRLAGSTPIAIPGLPAGPATVRIELDGYRPWTTTVSVGAGDQTRVAASLERR